MVLKKLPSCDDLRLDVKLACDAGRTRGLYSEEDFISKDGSGLNNVLTRILVESEPQFLVLQSIRSPFDRWCDVDFSSSAHIFRKICVQIYVW